MSSQTSQPGRGLAPDTEAVGKLQRVLQNLLFERVPIRLAHYAEVLSEHSRIDDVKCSASMFEQRYVVRF